VNFDQNTNFTDPKIIGATPILSFLMLTIVVKLPQTYLFLVRGDAFNKLGC
jgi:hypothetical protein